MNLSGVLVDPEDAFWLKFYPWHISGGYVSGCNPYSKPRRVLLHRVILDAPPGLEVDHINGDKLDNRKDNLRLVNHAHNQQNRHGLNKRNRSGFRGVSWHSRDRRWQADLRANGRTVSLGYFDTVEAANTAVKESRRKHMPTSEEDKCV
jgi:hypothetical protein